MTRQEINENKIWYALEKANIPYEILRREDGWIEIGFCVKEFDRGELEDWGVMCIDSGNYAIYHKTYNQEWQDKYGDNLVFYTKNEAKEYLRKEFGEIKDHEQDCPAIDGFGCKCGEEVK